MRKLGLVQVDESIKLQCEESICLRNELNHGKQAAKNRQRTGHGM